MEEMKITKQFEWLFDGFMIYCKKCKLGGENIILHINYPSQETTMFCNKCKNLVKVKN